ncbi:hypothetical protein LJC63_09520 [Ruminococcaceae bacterium OttesenSCG-928-L11]|nr:hypothetical protein [Ruminococcaceae bacterium OttesenSCG-928-L11]
MGKLFLRRKFYARIFCILMLAALIPSYMTTLFFYRDYASNIAESATNSNKRMLEYVGGALDEIAYEMRRTAYDGALRNEFAWFASNAFYIDPIAFEKLSQKLYRLVENISYIDALYVYFENYDYLLESHNGVGTSYVRLENLGDNG